MIIILIGPPGSGKSTQAKMVAAKLNLPHISMGQILREAKREKTMIGLEASKYAERGNLVPSKMIQVLTRFRLEEKDCEKGFVLDGAPRKVEEAVMLDDYLSKKEKKVGKTIIIECKDEVIIERLLSRSKLSKKKGGGRVDDNMEDIRVRIQEYKDNIEAIKVYYRSKDILELVNGDMSIEEVNRLINSILQL